MPNVVYKCRVSRHYCAMVIGFSLITLIILIFSNIALISKCIFLSILSFYIHYLWGLAVSACTLICLGEGRWRVIEKDQIYEGTLCGDSTLTQWVSVLRFRVDGYFLSKNCVIFADALGKTRYRQCLVMLRMY